MTTLYVLVVDKAWAKLYRTGPPPSPLKLVYHQALFGRSADGNGVDDELARSLCRLLRTDRQAGKFQHLIMLASGNMLEALHRQYDGEWSAVTVGRLEDLPPRYTDEDIGVYLHDLLELQESEGSGLAVLLRPSHK